MEVSEVECNVRPRCPAVEVSSVSVGRPIYLSPTYATASCRYHTSRFYGVQSSAMVKANSSHLAMQTSKNIGIITLASANPRKHFANIQVPSPALF